MRSLGVAAALVLTLAAGSVATNIAAADEPSPSKADVQAAEGAVSAAALDVDAVRARLVVANQQLQQSAVVAAQASEAYNGARWRAAQARKAVAAAEQRSTIAEADVERQRATYADAMVTSYQLVPGLTGLSAIVHSDGIETVLQRTATMENAEDALDGQYDEFRASATLADVAQGQAEDARTDAEQAAADALTARQAAQRAADAAAAQAQSIAAEKDTLISRLADLEHVSVRLAARRQAALEQEAAAAAARSAQREQERADEQEQPESAADPAPTPTPTTEASPDPTPEPTSDPTPSPSAPAPSAPAPAAPPAPSGGAAAAIAFARAQIGEPYRWGAAGPSSWDCSGLTMGAWSAGGRGLPHYSVAQYEQSTPISASNLQPGDLVFWGSSNAPSSIYHVALYVGNGRIVHAPRTGRPVVEESLYYWIAPNFYARP